MSKDKGTQTSPYPIDTSEFKVHPPLQKRLLQRVFMDGDLKSLFGRKKKSHQQSELSCQLKMSLNLFSHGKPTNDKNKLQFKAGRMVYNKETKMVSPDPRKGTVQLKNIEDGLYQFTWTDRKTGDIDLEFLIVPGDATYRHVRESRGRVYVLEFVSGEKHFFWMQEGTEKYDEDFRQTMNSRVSGVKTKQRSGKDSINKELFNMLKGVDTNILSLIQRLSDDIESDLYDYEDGDSSEGEVDLDEVIDYVNSTLQGDTSERREEDFKTQRETFLYEMLSNIPEVEHETAMMVLGESEHQEAIEHLSQALVEGNLTELLKTYGMVLPSGEGSSTQIESFLVQFQKKRKESDG